MDDVRVLYLFFATLYSDDFFRLSFTDFFCLLEEEMNE